MREPVLQDKRADHQRFCEQAKALIERVTQKPISDFPKDITQEKLWKVDTLISIDNLLTLDLFN